MRFNDKEIAKIGEGKADLEGVLSHMKPQGKEWSDWYQQSYFKERYFKLYVNLLYYYRINDTEPLGVLVLENAHVAYERPHKGIPFAFSLNFKVNDKFRDNEAKHIFSCRCDNDVNKWVTALKTASYEYWRTQRSILRAKLAMKDGKNPMLDYLIADPQTPLTGVSEVKKTKTKETKSTFYSHIETTSTFYESTSSSSREVTVTSNQTNGETVDNLITF